LRCPDSGKRIKLDSKETRMTSTSRRNTLLGALAVGGAGLLPAPVLSQEAGRTVRLVLGYAPGGPADQGARLFAAELGKVLNTVVVVDNKPGANATIAGNDVVRARPDGTTLWFAASATATVAPNIMKRMSFDPAKDLTPLAPVARYYNMLVANVSEPYKTTQELVAHAKAHPGALNYGSSGVGSSNHVAAVLFARQAGIELNHIPYKGNAPAMTDIIGGQLNLLFDIISTATTYVQSGRVKAIAVGSPKRSPSLPDVPTFRESGIKELENYESVGWYAIYGPQGMPTDVAQKLTKAVQQVASSPEFKARYAELGYEQWPGSTQELVDTAARERALLADVLKGVTME
jgi:tripartite-type tricarboxylate transporter receptor subunit TctC